MGRFALWGDGCAVSEGDLDLLFKDLKNNYLRESTVIPLCSIAKTLDACFSSLSTAIYQVTDQDPTDPNPKTVSDTLFSAQGSAYQSQFSGANLRRSRSVPSLSTVPIYEGNSRGDGPYESPTSRGRVEEYAYGSAGVRSRSLPASRSHCGEIEDM